MGGWTRPPEHTSGGGARPLRAAPAGALGHAPFRGSGGARGRGRWVKCQRSRPPRRAEHPKVTVAPRGPARTPTVRRTAEATKEQTVRATTAGAWGGKPDGHRTRCPQALSGTGGPHQTQRGKSCIQNCTDRIGYNRTACDVEYRSRVTRHTLPCPVVFKVKPPEGTECRP